VLKSSSPQSPQQLPHNPAGDAILHALAYAATPDSLYVAQESGKLVEKAAEG